MKTLQYQPGLHRIALLTAGATFPLIFMGGLVTSHQAGMSVPDWPNSYGYNMFLFPPRLWIGGILYEHTHRLMASVVGLLSIVLAAWAWKYEPRRWVRWLAMSVLGAVILQGVLGGLRVVFVKLDLAIVHACLAQAFFCLAALMACVTSRWWIEAEHQPATPSRFVAVRLASIVAGVIYLQLVAGAVMRHYQAGLAIPDLPLAYGKVLPPTNMVGLKAVNDWRAWHGDGIPGRVTLSQVWIHFAHRLGAIAVMVSLLVLIVHVLRHRHEPLLFRPAVLLIVLLVVQLTLGTLTVLWRKPADIASAHVAVGALTLLTTFVLGVRAWRVDAAAGAPRQYGFSLALTGRRQIVPAEGEPITN